MLKNIIKLAKGLLNNIFQDSFNIILSQQLTHDRSYISQRVVQVNAKRNNEDKTTKNDSDDC